MEKRLFNLYMENMRSIRNLKSNYEDLSNPLLIDIVEKYSSQNKRLFIVGQQTNSWYDNYFEKDNKKFVEKLMKNYKNQFKLGINYNSPFWDFVRKLENSLNIMEGQIVWSNIFKMDYNGYRPPEKIRDYLINELPLIQNEIKITKPDIVLFLTGPSYDKYIKDIFDGVKFFRIKEKNIKKIAKLDIPSINTKIIRTYHPKYLRLNKLENEMINIITDTGV